MERRPNSRLRALLAEAGWSNEQCARAVNSVGAEIGLALRYDRTSVAHWLSGTQPRPPVPHLVAETFSRRLGRVMTPVAAGFARSGAPAAGLPGPRTPPAPAVRTLGALTGRDADPVERAALAGEPYRALGAPPPWSDGGDPDRRSAGRRGLARVGGAEVDLLRGAVRHFAAAMDVHGGGHARPALAHYLADTATTWLHAPGDDRAHRQLGTQSAYLVFILARMHSDMGCHGIAQRYLHLALDLAREVQDRVAWAITLRAMAAQALHLEHRRTALRYAQAAVEALPEHVGDAVRAFALAQSAVAHAAVGDRDAALAALHRAEEHGRRAGVGDPFGDYPSGALSFQKAEVHRELGDLRAAARALHRSTQERPAHDRRGLALTLARRAELLLRSGRIAEACEVWHQFLEAGGGLRSHSVVTAVRTMRGNLEPLSRHPSVRALLDRERSLG
ncbi:tetratricopeptide repeat protein [Streptomyces cavernicola]|uniref:Transcriptional regulator n=1 Tax=Streptomyces cavernicola TaxID=3043613 RepID=A0ABT6SAL1_9ACTN|nr:hypothetical protein [Streptomyces sp. B-S-A6]MDI3405222.1 hypothetical protein [Streptomyces sp. B-S-A6]